VLPGDELTIEPVKLVAGGAAMARVDGFPIFATNVFPGDVAVVQLVEVKKGFAHAELLRLVTPSPLRRAAPCPVAGECGGCDWTALRLDAQLQAKEEILRESLRRIGKIYEPPEIALHPSALNYRLRSRLHRDGGAVGFFALRSNEVVPLARECEVVGVGTALSVAAGALARPAAPSASLRAGSAAAAKHEEEIWEVDGRLITDGEMLIDGYHVTADAFFQVNRHLLGTLRTRVTELAGRAKSRRSAIDLYSGVGFFSRPLAALFERVTAVEGSIAGHECAKRNVPGNVRLVNAAVETWAQGMPRADVVFLDPPRAGARREVIDAAAQRASEVIAYLSCDPVTFSRDANRLTASGWRLATLDLLDLFPNTHHVETLASFERAE
jgi:tRNA/tmRNA/rRNA uracil-C5-methylase (TrmA/RlmC/RlmD family)